jgi:NAD(P)-dependent dehydrogenase (short-subunit alcohol dehydrogenase family)
MQFFRKLLKGQQALIIGAAGNNGVETIVALINQKQTRGSVRAAVRSVDKATELKREFPSIETVIIDLDKPETLHAAYQAAVVSSDGEQLLGRPLTTLKAFISQNKAAFMESTIT